MTSEARGKLALVGAGIVLANLLDLTSTYAASPDLANEWNVLERVYHLGWAGLIITKIVGIALAITGYAYYLKKRDSCYPSAEPISAAHTTLRALRDGQKIMDRESFCRHLLFGRQAQGLEVLRGIPIGARLGVNLGYFWAGMQALVVWVAIDNLLLMQGFVFPLRHVSELGYHLFQSGIVTMALLWRFYNVNYARYQERAALGLLARSDAVNSTLLDTAVVYGPVRASEPERTNSPLRNQEVSEIAG